MIKILNKNEKDNTKLLWEEIFEEDSPSFIDYYYSFKLKENIILGKFINEKIVSMIHLNPYKLSFKNKQIPSYYIVGVATDLNHRKKGYMRELLSESLNNMYSEKIPFTFLMPAKEEIYLPFDFRYIYNHKSLTFKDSLNLKKEPIDESEYSDVAAKLNFMLKNKYEVFAIRDENYIKTLKNELKSENGDFLKVFLENKFIGYYLYWGIKNSEIRSIYVPDKYTDVSKIEPKIMARIVNLKSFLENIYLSKNTSEKMIFYIKIEDNIIKDNSNVFKWEVSNNFSSLEVCENFKNINSVVKLNISTLTSWIFGYISLNSLILENYVQCENKDILNKLSLIKIIDGIFLDEIV